MWLKNINFQHQLNIQKPIKKAANTTTMNSHNTVYSFKMLIIPRVSFSIQTQQQIQINKYLIKAETNSK